MFESKFKYNCVFLQNFRMRSLNMDERKLV